MVDDTDTDTVYVCNGCSEPSQHARSRREARALHVRVRGAFGTGPDV